MFQTKDYLLLSAFSYCNFSSEDNNKTLEEIYKNNPNKLTTYGFNFSNSETMGLVYNFFKDVFLDWKIFHYESKRASDLEKFSTGFYAVIFKNIKTDEYVLSFRGSEKYPFNDAYEDFIKNDLKIGIGIKPTQFYDGMFLFNKMISEFKIPVENISVTGHSLGGGIAQFVALMSEKYHGHIPKTYTWNAVGINKIGLVNIFEFLDLEINKKFIKNFVKNSKEEIDKAKDFFKKINLNKDYQNKIFNFSHSNDLTVYLIKQIGSTIYVDNKLSKKILENKEKNFPKFEIFSKSIQLYHYLDVFLPFINSSENILFENIVMEFSATVTRKIFTQEYVIDKNLLADYFSLVDINDENFEKIKSSILKAFIFSKENILYKDKVYDEIKKMEIESFKNFWEILKSKLSSPYRQKDIYDLIIFKK